MLNYQMDPNGNFPIPSTLCLVLPGANDSDRHRQPERRDPDRSTPPTSSTERGIEWALKEIDGI